MYSEYRLNNSNTIKRSLHEMIDTIVENDVFFLSTSNQRLTVLQKNCTVSYRISVQPVSIPYRTVPYRTVPYRLKNLYTVPYRYRRDFAVYRLAKYRTAKVFSRSFKVTVELVANRWVCSEITCFAHSLVPYCISLHIKGDYH